MKCRLADILQTNVQCAYSDSAEGPSLATEADRALVQSRWLFWKLINAYVMKDVPMPPVRVLCRVLQVFYSRTKEGVDCTPNFRSEINSNGFCVGWESKIVLYYFKRLLLNGVLVCRLTKCNEKLPPSPHLVSLERFKENLNRNMSFSDFTTEVPEWLQDYAKELDNVEVDNDIRNEEEGSYENISVRVPKRNHIRF